MKKIFLIAAIMALSVPLFATTNPDVNSYLYSTGHNRDFSVTADGGVLSSSQTIYGTIQTQVGFPEHQTWAKLPTASTTSIKGVFITTSTLQSAGTTWLDVGGGGGGADFTQITSSQGNYDCGRNISCSFEYSNVTDSTTCVGSMVITGYNCKGEYATETVVMSTMPAYSNNAFVRISAINVSMSASGVVGTQKKVYVFVGVSNKIGLIGDITSSSDVYKVTDGGTDLNRNTLSIDTTYDTIDLSRGFNQIPNGSEGYEVYFRRNRVK